MLWEIQSKNACSPGQFKNWDNPNEVLYEFEVPRIFTTIENDLMWLWYECAEDFCSNTVRYLVAPANTSLIRKLNEGTKTVHDALEQPWLWAVDVNLSTETVSNSWILGGLKDVPSCSKPQPDATLRPELQPLLSYRLIGRGLKEGEVPANVVKRAISNPTAALKGLLEIVSDFSSQVGRPTDEIRKMYGVVAKRFAYNSFEVAFDFPNPESTNTLRGAEDQTSLPGIETQQDVDITDRNTVYLEASKKLIQALEWLVEESNESSCPDLATLAVLELFSPPKHGQIEEAEIKGKILKSRPSFTLNREHTVKIKQSISSLKKSSPSLISEKGRIGEFDKDKFLCTLRDVSNSSKDISCSFPEELYDDIYDVFAEDILVHIHGKWRATGQPVLEISAIEKVEAEK